MEIDYEGDAQFLEKDLLKLVEDIQKIAPSSSHGHGHSSSSSGAKKPSEGLLLTTKSIATKLNAKSGPDVAKAAAAHLAISKGSETFSRTDLHNAMKTAAGHYKSSMHGNLTGIIKALLTDDILVETNTDIYSLTPTAEAKLKGQLGVG